MATETEKKVEESVPTAEELEAMTKAVNDEFFSNERLDRHDKPKEEPKAEEPPKPKPEPEKKKSEKKKEPKAVEETDEEKGGDEKAGDGDGGKDLEKEKPKPKKAQVVPIDEDEVNDIIEKKLEEKLPKKEPPKPETPPQPKGDEIDPQEQATLQRLEWLSKNDPQFKGRDLVAETKRFWQAEQDYITRWQRDNPGEQFDADAEEHQAFYSRNEPNVGEQDLNRAAVDLRITEAEKRIEEKAKKEADKRAYEEAARQTFERSKDVINESVATSIRDLVVSSVPEFEQLLEKDTITQEAFKKMEEEDPVALEVLNDEAGRLARVVQEIDTMVYCGQYYPLDKSNPVHQEIVGIGNALEKAILSKPADEQIHDGKRFLAQQDFNARINSIRQKPISAQEKRDQIERFMGRFWTVDLDQIKAIFVEKSVREVKKTLDLTNKRIKHIETKKSKKDEKPPDQEPQNTEKKSEKKKPAAVASSSDMVDSAIPKPHADDENWKLIDKGMWG